ncbi:prokineticin-2 [Betta splendens]|uniref:Prokineticin-2 n=1 Tax=Betta splendens TaxID=158456 RepID=A0A6P7MMN4_BETSP|nr:prokineticin-2 [Betta splendens]XP_029008081.1 prokineticin-2 [Betta splendens]
MSSEATLLLRSTRTHTHRRPSAAAFPLSDHRRPQEPVLIMQPSYLLLFCLLLVSQGSSAVITGACERDSQCGGSMCCAVSLWIRSLRMCTPMGQEGEECHPLSHKVPFLGKRLHHTCPCLPHLACITTEEGKSKCLSPLKNPDYYL